MNGLDDDNRKELEARIERRKAEMRRQSTAETGAFYVDHATPEEIIAKALEYYAAGMEEMGDLVSDRLDFEGLKTFGESKDYRDARKNGGLPFKPRI
jgi:hypothetical protein